MRPSMRSLVVPSCVHNEVVSGARGPICSLSSVRPSMRSLMVPSCVHDEVVNGARGPICSLSSLTSVKFKDWNSSPFQMGTPVYCMIFSAPSVVSIVLTFCFCFACNKQEWCGRSSLHSPCTTLLGSLVFSTRLPVQNQALRQCQCADWRL